MDVKLGICNFCVPGTGMFAPRFVAEAGLDGMSIEFGTYEKGFPLASRKLQEAYLDAQQQYGVAYPNIGMSGFDFIPFFAHKGQPMHEVVQYALRAAIDAAAYMKIPLVFIPSFWVSEVKTEEQFSQTVEMLQYACSLAEKHHIQIGSENAMDTKTQLRLCQEVNRDNFGLFYDSNNLYYNKGYDQAPMLDDLYACLVPQLHVKDGKCGVLGGALLGAGDSNFSGTMDVLKHKNYSGWIILENLYEQQPLRGLNEDVFLTFLEDIKILKAAVQQP